MTTEENPCRAPRRFRQLLADTVRAHADAPALRSRTAQGWAVLSWRQVGELAVEAARWFDAKPEVQRVAVLGPASVGAWILEAGALLAGVDINPIYEDALEDERAAALEATAPDLIAVGSPELAEQLGTAEVAVVDIACVLDEWRIHQAAAPRPTVGELAAWIERWSDVEAAVLLQSTGTTGPPKVIELTDSAMTAATWSLRNEIDLAHPRFLAFLPSAHTSHLLINFYAATLFAADVWIGGGVDTITEDLEACRPTVMFGAPLLFDAIRDEFRMEATGNPIGRLVYRALCKRADAILTAGEITRRSASRLGRLVGRFVARSAGLDAVEEFFSGTAPLDGETHAFFAALGWYVRNTYGLTECGGAATVSGRDRMVVGELGHLVEGLDIRFSDDGEILVRGEAIMRGKLGERPIEPGAWLATGDLGHAEGGVVRFTGRKSEVVQFSDGSTTSLRDLDAQVKAAVPTGHGVTVRLDEDRLGLVVCREENGAPAPPRAQVLAALADAELGFDPGDVVVSDEPLSRERGELGATGKVRRWKVRDRLGVATSRLA